MTCSLTQPHKASYDHKEYQTGDFQFSPCHESKTQIVNAEIDPPSFEERVHLVLREDTHCSGNRSCWEGIAREQTVREVTDLKGRPRKGEVGRHPHLVRVLWLHFVAARRGSSKMTLYLLSL